MENLLFIVSGYYPDSRSGAQVIKHLAEELKQTYNIYVYTLDNSIEQYECYEQDDIAVIRNCTRDKNKVKRLIGRLDSIFRGIVYCNMLYIYKEATIVKELIEDKKITQVISVCSPIESHVVAFFAKKNCNFEWSALYLDPFFSNQQLKKSLLNKRKKMEYSILKKADKILAYNLIFNDFKNQNIYSSKLYEIYFPGILKHDTFSFKKEFILNNKKINCLFMGTLYADIRSPEYFFQMCQKIDDDQIQFYFIGSKIGFKEEYFKNWEHRLKNRLYFYDRVEEEIIYFIANQANILINIGNLVSNQIPGKIFDYISLGKPIVNIYKLHNCPSLEYLENYPYKINIFEGDRISINSVSMKNFIKQNYCEKVEFDQVYETYKAYTPQEVAHKFTNILQYSVSKK